jgi:peptide/nickel transport system substrate-binding protein
MRSSRRGTKAGIAALMSFTLLAAACGGNDDGTGTPAPEGETGSSAPESESSAVDGTDPAGDTAPDSPGVTIENAGEVEEDDVPQPGGTLRYGLEADVDGLNPTSSALSAPGLMMGNAVYDTLTARTVDGTFVPYLAESVEPNEDFTVWTVKVREGITFHDGTPLNSAAIITNFETARADPLVGLAVKPFYPETGATTVVDDLTVQFNLLEGNRYFPGALSGQLGMVASPTWIEAAKVDGTLNQQPVGTGPFVFDSRSEDSVTRFVRNDNWWNGEVYLDAVEFVPVTDAATRNDLFFGGELEALQASDPESVDELRADESIQGVFDESGEESFAMINSAVPPFDDIRARQALSLAAPITDYRDLIGLGISTPANGQFTPDSPYYNPDVVQVGDDPTAALALVAEYCAERGADINTVLTPPAPTCTDGRINIELQWSGPSVIQTRIADILDAGWTEGGFNVTFQELAQDAQIQQAALGQYNVVTWRQFGAEDPSLDNVWLLCRNIGGISLNWPKFCDEERDALLLQGQLLEDGPERDALYQEVSRKLNEDFLYIFFIHTPWETAFAENLRGMCDRTAPTGEQLICATNGRNWFSSAYFAT